jgi:hypothetical protein
MSMPGCQWGFVELRCPARPLRMLRELLEAFGDLYEDAADSDNDGYHRQNID